MSNSTQRKAHHPYETKDELIRRLKRIEGQVRGIAKMIENDVYCDDILHQFLSVESALDSTKIQLLDAHVNGCVVNRIQNGENEVVGELMKTVKQMLK